MNKLVKQVQLICKIITSKQAKACHFLKQNQGVAVAEFAFIFPVLLSFFYGVFEIANYNKTLSIVDEIKNNIGHTFTNYLVPNSVPVSFLPSAGDLASRHMQTSDKSPLFQDIKDRLGSLSVNNLQIKITYNGVKLGGTYNLWTYNGLKASGNGAYVNSIRITDQTMGTDITDQPSNAVALINDYCANYINPPADNYDLPLVVVEVFYKFTPLFQSTIGFMQPRIISTVGIYRPVIPLAPAIFPKTYPVEYWQFAR